MRYKYPRTYHLPWSEGITNDDKVLKSTENFEEELIVVTEKMDGENTTLYKEGSHARSIDSKHHPSRDWLKAFHSTLSYKFDEVSEHCGFDNLRICGENLYAKHSIKYTDLESYFYGFSAWDGEYCLNWDLTMSVFHRLGITPVPVLSYAIFDEGLLRHTTNYREGYVVRLAAGFHMEDFSESVAKFVRANHVQTDIHWMNSKIIPNELRRYQ